MNYTNKKFTDLTNGRVVEVISQFDDVAVLSDKTRIKVNRLSDRNYFDEYIDPQAFLKNENLFANFADKIHNSLNSIPDDSVTRISVTRDDVNEDYPEDNQASYPQNRKVDLNNIPGSTKISPTFNESAVLMSDPEAEKMELIRKYGMGSTQMSSISENNHNALNTQMDRMRGLGILDEDDELPKLPSSSVEDIHKKEEEKINNTLFEGVKMEDAPFIPKSVANTMRERMPEQWPPISPKIPINVNQNRYDSQVQPKQNEVVDDPIIKMFQNVKRNTQFNIDVTINEKIPRLDFIEMMEDSYNQSIIDFLSDEFTNRLLSNPSIIRDMIKEKITKMVYKNETEDNSVKVKVLPTDDLEVLHEDIEKKPRKTRLKKEEQK